MSFQRNHQPGGNPYQLSPDQQVELDNLPPSTNLDSSTFSYPGESNSGYENFNSPHDAHTGRTITVEPPTAEALPPDAFFRHVTDIKTQLSDLSTHVQYSSHVYQRALSDPSPTTTAALDSQTSTASALATDLRTRIQSLEADASRRENSPDVRRTKQGQVRVLKASLRSTLEEWQRIQRDHRERSREQARREWRIVRPDASEAEIEEAARGAEGGQAVFVQAIQTSGRSAQAQTALGAVRARHDEIQRIEKSMEDLVVLFRDLNDQVVAHEAPVQHTEMRAEQVVKDSEAAVDQIKKGIWHARNRKKLKWWLLGLVILIIVVLALVLGLYFGVPSLMKNKGVN